MTRTFFLAAVASVALLIIPTVAWAYIDAGSGSYVLQILAAGLLGGLFAIKSYWKQLVVFAGRLLGRRRETAEADDD